MAIGVVDFYRRIEGRGAGNPFIQALENPTFYILARVNGKVRELVLKLSGSIPCPALNSFDDFEVESYRNYLIVAEFLLSEEGESVRHYWGLSKKDFRELIFKMYFALVREHATCSLFKKVLLIAIGMWKFIMGRRLK